MPSSEAILHVEHLSKTYKSGLLSRKGLKAIDDVSLDVGTGTVFGLLGPNGAGKTTLIKVLLGLVRGYKGDAAVFGEPPSKPASRRRVGYLPEAHRLPGYLTGRQVLELFGMMAGRDRESLRRRIAPLLERVGMLKNADRKVREYSKGMQQRVGLAQALVHDPELVFLDEPTDGVDPVGRASIREIVVDLKKQGKTIFINSHLLMEVELICDRVVIMNRGKIVRDGTIEELTPSTGSVRFELSEERSDIEKILDGIGQGLTRNGRFFDLRITAPAQQDEAIDKLRAAGVSIRAIAPRRLTLEESFIDLVRSESRGARN